MTQHFLLSAGARSLSAAKIMRMSDGEVEAMFLRLRWPETDGKPVCPDCGCTICYACPRPTSHLRWRCKACRRDVSITSGTLFASHKLPLRSYLLAVAVFCNEVKAKSALANSHAVGTVIRSSSHRLAEKHVAKPIETSRDDLDASRLAERHNGQVLLRLCGLSSQSDTR